MTPKQVQIGIERLKDPGATNKAVALRAGYSEQTADKVRLNSWHHAGQVVKAGLYTPPVSPSEAQRIGLETAMEFAQDRSGNPAGRLAGAKCLLEWSGAAGVGEEVSTPDANDRFDFSLQIQRIVFHALKWGMKNPERAQAAVDRITRNLEAARPTLVVRSTVYRRSGEA